MEVTKIIITDKLVFSVTDLILFITFMAICWYAWETRKVKNEMVRQNELNLCPIILVDLDEGREGFIYKNQGRGIALKVETEDVILKSDNPPKTNTLKFDSINHILVNQVGLVRGRVMNESGSDVGGFNIFFAHFDPVVAEYDFEIPIQYTDILGTQYETIMGCGKGGIRIIKFEKKTRGPINCLRKKLRCQKNSSYPRLSNREPSPDILLRRGYSPRKSFWKWWRW